MSDLVSGVLDEAVHFRFAVREEPDDVAVVVAAKRLGAHRLGPVDLDVKGGVMAKGPVDMAASAIRRLAADNEVG